MNYYFHPHEDIGNLSKSMLKMIYANKDTKRTAGL